MIAVAGYINYSDNIKGKNKTNAASGDPVIESETDPVSGEILSNDAEPDDNSLTDPGAAVFTSTVTSEFIISAKLEREQVRATNKESLLEIINNADLAEETKAKAVSDMVALTDAAEKEAAAELLLEAKGFQNVIVSISGEQVDVVVEKTDFTDVDLAQVEDVVTRKAGCTLDNLRITSVAPASKTPEETNPDTEETTSAPEETTTAAE